MSGMYTIEFKKTARAKKVIQWERFAESLEAAVTSASKALDEEYFGEAVMVGAYKAQ